MVFPESSDGGIDKASVLSVFMAGRSYDVNSVCSR